MWGECMQGGVRVVGRWVGGWDIVQAVSNAKKAAEKF